MISDSNGNLYGTTFDGGNGFSNGGGGGGVVYMLTPPTTAGGAWAYSVIYSFPFSDPRFAGITPAGGLVSDPITGALYGTAYQGGAFVFTPPSGTSCIPSPCTQTGYGTIYKLTPPATPGGPWTQSVLYTFSGGPFYHGQVDDGAGPWATMIMDASGALYGPTAFGGTYNRGTIYKLSPPITSGGNWTLSTLYSFTGGADGGGPEAPLTLDSSGALYGTTVSGGPLGDQGFGTVFKLAPAGGSWIETVLYSFGANGDGGFPLSSLVFDASGALYGTTFGGGAFDIPPESSPIAGGTIFMLTPPSTGTGPWVETLLHSFSGTEGAYPAAGLMPDSSGALYGTTEGNEVNGQIGTVFKIAFPATFTGIPGKANCAGQSISFMAKKYGGIAHAADSLGYPTVAALQNAVVAYCGG